MKYIAYDETGKIHYFYESTQPIGSAPEGLVLLQVSDDVIGDDVNTHCVVNGEMVSIQ